MAASFLLFVAAVTSGIIWLSIVDTPLPMPGQKFAVVDVDPAHLPTDNSPLEGIYAPNDILKRAHRIFDGLIHASESVAIGPDGNLTLLDKYGYLYEAEPARKVPNAVVPDEFALDPRPLAYVGPGRPLGFHFDGAGNIIICDSLKGLLLLEANTNKLVVLANQVSADSAMDPGLPLTYVNDLDIVRQEGGAAAGGSSEVVYFSTSQEIPVGLDPETGTFYDTFRSYLLGLFAGSFTGRLLRHDRATGRTEVLAKGIWYANGVAVAPDGSFVAVVETSRLRVLRYWLSGPKAGTMDVLIGRLPGFPDGISRSADGNFWLALVAPVGKLPRLLRYKALRAVLAYLPKWARPPVPRIGCVLKLSPEGAVLQTLMDPDGQHIAYVSSVTEHGGRLYFGNVVQSYNSYIDLRDIPQQQQQ